MILPLILAIAIPVKDGTPKSAKDGFVHFKGKDKFDYVYTDKSPTLIKAVKEIRTRAIPHETSVPGVPATNGIAEAMVKRTIRGIRANLAQAWLPRAYWRRAAEHHWMALNIQDQESDGKSPWERRHRHVFDGIQLPFGSLVHYIPSPISKDPSGKLESNAKEGVFLGYVLQPSHKCNGEYLVASLDNFVGKD